MPKPRYRKLTFDVVPLPQLMRKPITDIEVLPPGRSTHAQRILAVTSDATLGLSRALVLQRAGFHVIGVNTAEQVEAALDLGPYDVFVVGHPMAEAEREQIVAELKGFSPHVPMVEIHGYGTPRMADVAGSVESDAGPAALVKAMLDVFEKQPVELSPLLAAQP